MFHIVKSLLIICLFITSSINGAIDANGRKKNNCWTSGNKLSARWWEEGTIIERGKYWYQCERGNLEPRGCFSNKNMRIRIGEKYVENGYEMTCVLGSEGYLQFNFTHCVPDGIERYGVGESWIDSSMKTWYVCKKDGPYLRMDVGGCLAHDKKTKLKIDEDYDYNGFVYTCRQKAGGSVQMCASGCIASKNYYKIGGEWNDDKYIYYCKQKSGRASVSIIGCVYKGKRLFDGDSFIDGDKYYQCQIRETSYGIKSNGCVLIEDDGSKEKKTFGCRWIKKLKNGNKVQQTCLNVNGEGKIKTEACIFVKNGKELVYLEPNYYTIFRSPDSEEPKVFACKINEKGKYNLGVYKIHESKDMTIGMKYDIPRGK
uniref:Ig-like domain-containing protein n=1 Tax=Strongyloides venezuelensis TaxID=75913 RepID=A0A0K0EWX5_STRVS